MKITWSAEAVDYKENSGIVINVHWSAVGEEDGVKATFISTSSFEGDESSPDFIPYENLQEATVLSWVKESLGPDGIEKVHKYLQENIALEKVKVSTGVPWRPPVQWGDLSEE